MYSHTLANRNDIFQSCAVHDQRLDLTNDGVPQVQDAVGRKGVGIEKRLRYFINGTELMIDLVRLALPPNNDSLSGLMNATLRQEATAVRCGVGSTKTVPNTTTQPRSDCAPQGRLDNEMV